MGRTLYVLGKVLIGAFCLWHMTAVFSYSLYHVDHVPALKWISEKRVHFRPYLLTISQWQRWNLFSPDPLRRVIELDIQVYDNDVWQTIYTLNEHNVGWWQRAPELKTMRRMEDDNKKPLRKRYAQDYCRTRNIPHGTRLRLVKRWHVIPKHDITYSELWWNHWKPDWRQEVDFEFFCESQ